MTDIKPIISLLCKHLNFLLDIKIKPEMFRLAKYDKSDDNVVEIFWRLLNSLIPPDHKKSNNKIKNVKNYFLNQLKYKSCHLYTLPEDMSHGSRELLVAFAYLLSEDYLNKHIEEEINNSPFNPHARLEIDNADQVIPNYTFNLSQLKTEDDLLNAVEWVEGQISYNRRITLDFQNHFRKLANKICEQPSVTKKESLTLLEALALSNADKAKEFLTKTERVAKIVQNHERWLKKQSVFWEWMDSVLRERKLNSRPTNIEELQKFTKSL